MLTLNFKTPIRQVSSSIYESTPIKDIFNYCPCKIYTLLIICFKSCLTNSLIIFLMIIFIALMAIRTMSGTTFLKIINSESELNAHNISSQVHLKAIVLDSILHERGDNLDHMHVTFNPIIYGEAAIVDGNGGIHLWRGERHEDYSK